MKPAVMYNLQSRSFMSLSQSKENDLEQMMEDDILDDGKEV